MISFQNLKSLKNFFGALLLIVNWLGLLKQYPNFLHLLFDSLLLLLDFIDFPP
jgi:hypothetical protein